MTDERYSNITVNETAKPSAPYDGKTELFTNTTGIPEHFSGHICLSVLIGLDSSRIACHSTLSGPLIGMLDVLPDLLKLSGGRKTNSFPGDY